MAEVVLIHGIAQEQEGPASLEAKWLPALSDGVRAAGYGSLADRIWGAPGRPGVVDARMAAYGDLFLTPGAQGSDNDLDDLDPEALALAEGLAEEWLRRAVERNDHPDHNTAALELGYLESTGEIQGVREEAARAVLNAVARLEWFAVGSMGFTERFINKSLRQVTAYMTNPQMRESILERVLPHLGPDTKVVIGHSLGSVVAYEVAANHLTSPMPLLVTLGSPLGLRTVVYDRLQPQPPTYPKHVQRWVNIADRNDLVAAEPDLSKLFPTNELTGITFEASARVNNGSRPHDAEYYLRKPELGRPVADALFATGNV
jgi:pimeloyl-ACP methyl ester carboxylesterase